MDRMDWVERIVRDFLDDPGENRIAPDCNEPAWGPPLIGVSRGDDALYHEIKEEIGPFYWTPLDVFRLAHPGVACRAEELSVIVWVLPHTEATKRDQRAEMTYPARRWTLAWLHGEEINDRLRDRVAGILTAAGFPAVAPVRHPAWSLDTSPAWGIASAWSERHAAYVSGLGTFGLSDGLITPSGKAVRIGSVVAKIGLPPTPRPYTNHYAYCIHTAKGGCGACVWRCPAGAITGQGHDKQRCMDYIRNMTSSLNVEEEQPGDWAHSCGLCQTRVPCESGIPVEEDDELLT